MDKKYERQVPKSHYEFGRYYFPGRWMSYWHETDEILRCDFAKTVLDVGPGSDLLKNILKTFNTEIDYKTVDVATDLNPDYVGSVTKLPFEDNSFDVVCAFQVLEHIEFADVPAALQELQRVARRRVLISLPHYGPSIEFWLKLPFLRRLRLATKVPHPKQHTFQGQHYWEIGKKGYSPRRIRSLLQEHFTLVREYVPFENQYHHFYVLDV